MHADKVISEARARIIWGEPVSSVHDFLISNGISDVVADAKLTEFNGERNRELRKIGLRNILIGAVLAIAAVVALSLVSLSRQCGQLWSWFGPGCGGYTTRGSQITLRSRSDTEPGVKFDH
jgi:hypothetical protein